MTVEELLAREAIRDVMARYNMAGDRARFDDFVALFTEDAVFETRRSKWGEGFRCEGRAAITAWADAWRNPPTPVAPRPTARPAPEFVRHHITTSQIDVIDAETADARTYWSVYTQIGPDHCGHYVDRFREEGGRWLFAARSVRVDWHAENGLFRQQA